MSHCPRPRLTGQLIATVFVPRITTGLVGMEPASLGSALLLFNADPRERCLSLTLRGCTTKRDDGQMPSAGSFAS
ncbi:hypothetical protein F5B18DRAFT_614136 [Nemania serpens]|nr:hypothetical protein F5B18DRAFT_614136 [Nemania serpens]